jgi:hypothetical protein
LKGEARSRRNPLLPRMSLRTGSLHWGYDRNAADQQSKYFLGLALVNAGSPGTQMVHYTDRYPTSLLCMPRLLLEALQKAGADSVR